MVSSSFPILIVAPPTVSEAVLYSGLVKRLADEMEHARFTVLGDPAATGLYRDLPGLERILPLTPAMFGLHWVKLWLKLRRRRWGLVLDMAGTPITGSLRARRRAIRKPLSAALGPVHKVAEAARILQIDEEAPVPFLFTGAETEAAADALVGVGDPRPILALAPAADWVGRAWPAERFAVAAAELLSERGPMSGGRLMIVGGPEDRWATEAVRRAIPRDRLIDLSGRADLLATYACLRRARLFIGNDSIMSHLAAAVGAPSLVLFGPSDERVWGPIGPRSQALRGPRDLDAIKRVDPGLNQAVCHMQDLPVAWVVSGARRLLDATQDEERTDG